LFALIRYLRTEFDIQLTRIQPGTGAIAHLESDTKRVEVYYDAGGPVSFFERYPTPAELSDEAVPEMLRRQAAAVESHAELVDGFLSKGSQKQFYNGRPDAVVVEYDTTDTERLQRVVIGEFKYTASADVFSRGLRELLEYLYLARTEDDYLLDAELEASSTYGLLCTDSVGTETDQIGLIRHWDADRMQEFF
jgi:hypothetical protein